jgi:putative DNA primase/helicase
MHKSPTKEELDASFTGQWVPKSDMVQARTVNLLPGSAYKAEDIRWLWKGWLAHGKVHLLAGSPGTGKSTIAINLAAAITSGDPWPDRTEQEAGDVLVWSGEDGITDTLMPRFLAANGDRHRIFFVDATHDGEERRLFDPATDMAALEEAASKLPALKLLILDPVVSAITGDSHKNTEVRRAMKPVVDLAEKLGIAVLGITHFTKNTTGKEPLDRVVGSLAFGAVARIVLATVKPADIEAPRRLVRAKSNIGPDTGGFEYQLFGAPVPGCSSNVPRVDWGQILEGSARELMAIEKLDDQSPRTDAAKEFLQDILKDGPIPQKDVRGAADAHGHAWATVRLAKENLKVVATKTGLQGGWAWKLPEAPRLPEYTR